MSSRERNVDPMYAFNACVGKSPIADEMTYLGVLTLVTWWKKRKTNYTFD